MGHVFIWIKPNKSKVIRVSLCSHLICSEKIYRTENSFNNPMKYHHNHRLFYICWMMVIKLKYCKNKRKSFWWSSQTRMRVSSCLVVKLVHLMNMQPWSWSRQTEGVTEKRPPDSPWQLLQLTQDRVHLKQPFFFL